MNNLLETIELEGDELVWTHNGIHCYIRRIQLYGHLCGYCLVPKDNKLYKKPYNKIQSNVHGGITYSEIHDFSGINGWWIGFDCCHGDDLMPYMKPQGFEAVVCNLVDLFDGTLGSEKTYKTMNFAQVECNKLAEEILNNKENI